MDSLEINYLSSNLKHLRLINNKTLKEVAGIVGKSDVAIHYWEDGSREPNSVDLYKLADYYKIRIDDLVKTDLRLAKKESVIKSILFLPNNVFVLREKNNITKEELATKLGYTIDTVESIENGRKRADLYDVAKLSKIFNISADDLLNKDLSKSNKYTKEEVKEKVTNIVDNSELEENKKITIKTMVNMICEDEK